MPKVVFVNRFFAPDHSATSQILSDLAYYLARSGLDVHVVTSRLRYDDPAARLAAHEVLDGVHVHRVWTSRFGRGNLVGRALDYFSFYVASGLQLLRLLGRGDVVVAKTDPPLISIVAAGCAALRGATHVNWLQDVFPEVALALGMRLARGLLGRLLVTLRDWSLHRAAVNVAIGDRMAAVVRARGVPPERVALIPNWADGQAIRPLEPASNPLRTEWALGNRFVVGYSGNMGRAHDLQTLLQAAERLRDDPRICFLFIGAGNQREAIETEALRLRLTNVMFKSYQPRERLGLSLTVPDVHIVSLLPELEGLIVPSKFYGVAAAGRPTLFVGAFDSEIGSLVRFEGCGTSIEPGNADVMAEFIRKWANDPVLVAQMGNRARALFDARFDMRLLQQKWLTLLSGLLPH